METSFECVIVIVSVISGEVANIHMRTDAKNLVTTARTIHLPEQKGDNPHDFYVAKGSLFREYS